MAWNEYSRETNGQIAQVLQILYATSQAAPSVPDLAPLTEVTLGEIDRIEGVKNLLAAVKVYQQLIASQKAGTPAPALPPELDTSPIDGAQYLPKLESPLQQIGCSAAVYHGPSDLFAHVSPNSLYDATPVVPAMVPLNKFYILDLAWRCRPTDLGLSNLLLIDATSTGDGWLVGVPYQIYMHLDAKIPIRLGGPLWMPVDKTKLIATVPDRLRKFVTIDDRYVVLTSETIERLVLIFAQQVSGKIETRSDLKNALVEISTFADSTLSIEGLAASALAIINGAPFVAFLLIYLVHLRLRVIRKLGASAEEPWLFYDVPTKFDLRLASVLATVPALCTLLIGFFFADVQGFVLAIPYLNPIDPRSFFGVSRWIENRNSSLTPPIYFTIIAIYATCVLVLSAITLLLAYAVRGRLIAIARNQYAYLKGD